MSELLFEIFCEEIPARMQPRAEADLEKLLGDKLKAAGLAWSSLTTFAGPRRLGLVIEGLPVKTEDVREERKGPRVGAPDKAVEGFLRGAGVASLDQCEKREDKKGEFWVAIIEKPGRTSADVIAEAIPEVMKSFPWPKSMKFGEDDKAQRWVRPIQRLLCLFDGEVVDFEVFGIRSGNVTEGHRRMGRGPFTITDYAQYTKVLREEGHVIQSRAEREALILEGARKVCTEAGLELVEDAGLLTEVAGLVEWPVPLLGEMDPDFLDLPPEVITLTMKTHQKYFAVKKPGEPGVTSKFVCIANQVAPDGGVAIAAGNARVLSARLSDARHFWDNDRKTPLSDMAAQLSKVTFHEKLGTVADKVERVAALARELAPVVGADPDLAEKAA
ncbi:MAG: glycine--tRNA ligase subunit beta, partial [Alphaproteobacteria bacterium]|nr:glycine--tRNA ligase subunit beta [Alphaproteobacteria bacterium]